MYTLDEEGVAMSLAVEGVTGTCSTTQEVRMYVGSGFGLEYPLGFAGEKG